MGQLPPLKPNCCPLSDFVKREEKPGPSRSYGTRGKKKQRFRKKSLASILALEAHPRKSPREHASTLAILGSAGLLHRRKHIDDTKSTASEDTVSETYSNKLEPVLSEMQQTSESVSKLLSEVFDDAADYEVPDELMEEQVNVMTSTNTPDVLNLVSEYDSCEIIREHISTSRVSKRGHKLKKKNRTGWPNKKKVVKKEDATTLSANNIKNESVCDQSSVEGQDEVVESSEADEPLINTITNRDSHRESDKSELEDDKKDDKSSLSSDDRPLRLDVNFKSDDKDKVEAEKVRSSTSDVEEDKSKNNRTRRFQNVNEWLQPVVRVARVDVTTRKLRSAAKSRSQRLR